MESVSESAWCNTPPVGHTGTKNSLGFCSSIKEATRDNAISMAINDEEEKERER